MKKSSHSKKADKRHQKELAAKQASIDLFNKFYQQQYGTDRWNELLIALKKPVRYCALVNKWADPVFAQRLLGIDAGDTVPYLPDSFGNAYIRASALHREAEAINDMKCSEEELPPSSEVKCTDNVVLKRDLLLEPVASSVAINAVASIETINEVLEHDELDMNGTADTRWPAPGLSSSLDDNSRCCYYPLDAASLFPVKLLSIEPDSRVLDLCAAPGGKSLAILQYLTEAGSLVSADVSTDRRQRLRNVLRRYIPPQMMDNVTVASGDGTTSQFIVEFGKRSFDRVLVDAPCSSERHVLHTEAELLRWAPGRSKGNAERQMALLLTALQLCRVGGIVVYSTCSLSTHENDAVVTKVLRRHNKKIKKSDDGSRKGIAIIRPIAPALMPIGEPTEMGWHILPDKSFGWGPIYLSVIDVVEQSGDVDIRQVGDSDGENPDADVDMA